MNIFISIQTKKLYQVFFFKECIHLKTECFQISLVMALGLTKEEVSMFNDSFTIFFLSQYSFCFFPIMNRRVKTLDSKSLYSK